MLSAFKKNTFGLFLPSPPSHIITLNHVCTNYEYQKLRYVIFRTRTNECCRDFTAHKFTLLLSRVSFHLELSLRDVDADLDETLPLKEARGKRDNWNRFLKLIIFNLFIM